MKNIPPRTVGVELTPDQRNRQLHRKVIFVLLLLAILVAILCSGCQQPPMPERFPIIRTRNAYPPGTTAESFWAAKKAHAADYAARHSMGMVTPEEQETMRHLLEIEQLRRGGEKRILLYNNFARERNRANGY